MKNLILLMLSVFTIALSEILWFGIVMRKFYIQNLGNILRFNHGKFAPSFAGSLIVWITISFGHLIFVLPKVTDANYLFSFIFGALFGAMIYTIYNFTNFAILTKWPKNVLVLDILWGTLINGFISTMMYQLNKFFTINTYVS